MQSGVVRNEVRGGLARQGCNKYETIQLLVDEKVDFTFQTTSNFLRLDQKHMLQAAELLVEATGSAYRKLENVSNNCLQVTQIAP